MTIPQPDTRFDQSKLIAYLEARGFPNDQRLRVKAQIEFVGPNIARQILRMKEDNYDRRLAIVYRYPGRDYATVRWFGQYLGPFGSVIDRKTDNPTGLPLHLYKSPLTEWERWDGETLYICESSLKALVLSHHAKVAAIAGSGVWGLCPKEQLVEDWEDEIKPKKVIILYDNDWRRNRNVRASIRRLGNLIKQRWEGTRVVHGALGDPPTGSPYWDVARGKDAGKWGIDDAIAFLSVEKALALIEEKEIEPTERELAIDDLNTRYAVCQYPPGIIHLGSGNLYSRADFTGLVEAHKNIWIADKHVPVAKVWLAEPDRNEVKKIVYEPGQDVICDGNYNRWRDDGPVAEKGDVSEFLRVYENAIPDEESRNLVFDCFAYILQNRTSRLPKNFIFVGRQVGTGKSLLASVLGTLLGKRNSVQITMQDFESSFNGFFAEKELIVIDDIHRMGEREVAKLKAYTTAEKIMVNTKNVKQYEVTNKSVFIITTNEYAGVAMDDVERRNVVIHFDPKEHHGGDSQWWKDFFKWFEDRRGANALRWWFENRNIEHFDPNFMPPMTNTKKKMIAAGKTDLENWVIDLYYNVDDVLGEIKRSVFTGNELWLLYAGGVPNGNENRLLGNCLAKYFDQANEGKLVKVGGKPQRYWKIRRKEEKWDSGGVQDDVRAYAVGLGEVKKI